MFEMEKNGGAHIPVIAIRKKTLITINVTSLHKQSDAYSKTGYGIT